MEAKALFVGGPAHGKIQAMANRLPPVIEVPVFKSDAEFYSRNDPIPLPVLERAMERKPVSDVVTYVHDQVSSLPDSQVPLAGRIQFYRPEHMHAEEAIRLLRLLPISILV